MTAFLLLFAILVFSKIEYAPLGSFHKDYLSKESTLPNKGIFVGLIIMSHFMQYVDQRTSYDSFYWLFRSTAGQLVVTMFLFYSGYGVYSSIKATNSEYLKKLPKKSLSLLGKTAIIVTIYLVIEAIFLPASSIKHIILSYLLWDSAGNSNWYIFAIIILYLLTYLSYNFIKPSFHWVSFILLVFSTVAFIIVLAQHRDPYCYNTLLCFPFGVLYGMIHTKIENVVFKSNFLYYLSLSMLSVLFCLLYNRRTIHYAYYEMWSICFVAIFVLATMKIKFTNTAISILGSYVFEVYLLQRIPMILLNHKGTLDKQPYMSFIVCFIITILLSYSFKSLFRWINHKRKGTTQ